MTRFQKIARGLLHQAVLAGISVANAQTLVRTVNGPAASAQFGKACISVPDQNSDGFKDVLVGAPRFNGGRGAIYCVSGSYLAFGVGAQTLWSLAPSANPNDSFGFALADVGDVTGDGVHDFLVGQPGYDVGSGQDDSGAVRLVHGSTHTIVSLIKGAGGQLGSSLALGGDYNQNGFLDAAIGSPNYGLAEGTVFIVDGSNLTQSGAVGTLSMGSIGNPNPSDNLGRSVASGSDLTGDGVAEIVIGVPFHDSGLALDAGQVLVFDAMHSQGYFVDSFAAGEAFGSAVSIGDDYDGDGVADLVVGAPNSPNGSTFEVGRAVVLSGARVVAQTPPYEIYAFPFGSVVPPVSHTDPDPNFHFGAAVKACADLNNDGVGEIMVGAPGYFTQNFLTGAWNFRGLVRIFSGASGMQISSIVGGTTDRLGDGLAGAVGDLTGDGLREFVVAGSLSDVGGTDSGVLRCYQLFPVAPQTYCAGKINSLGCIPAIGFSGSPSASSSTPFIVTASNIVNQKSGLLFYSHSPAMTHFQGGFKCAGDPVMRTGVLSSGGSTSGSDCTGTFSRDFNVRIQSGIDPSLVAGAEVFVQWWSRDPGSQSTTSLTNALQFLINP